MVHKIHNEKLTVEVNALGAELFSVKSTDGTEYIWQGTAPYWNSRASIIFPVCGRLFGGKYTLDGKEYEMNLHGFARKTEFEVERESDTELVFSLCTSESTLSQYPFDFKLTGFNTNEQMLAKISIGVYVIENGSISYIQNGILDEGAAYSYITYDAIIKREI